jgi:hypothetical protein
MRFATDLTALGGTLSLEAGVVVVTLTDAGKVEACRYCQTLSLGACGSRGCVLLTVPPEVAEGGTETWCKRMLVSIY